MTAMFQLLTAIADTWRTISSFAAEGNEVHTMNRTAAMMRTRLVVGTVEGKAGFGFEITMKLDLFTNGGFVFTENTSNIGFGRFVVNPLSDNLTVSFRKMFIIC